MLVGLEYKCWTEEQTSYLLGQLLKVSSSKSSYSDLFLLARPPLIRGVFSPLRDFFCFGVRPGPELEL